MEGAAGVVGFVALGLQVCQGLLTYYSSWKDCRSDVADICASLQETERILVLLSDPGRRWEDSSNVLNSDSHAASNASLNAALQMCENTMKRLDKKVTKIQRSAGDDGFLVRTRMSWERVKYPLKESTILKVRDLLHQQKLDVILVLSVLGIDSSSATVAKLDGLDQKMKHISIDISSIDTRLAGCEDMLQMSGRDEKQQAVLKWLCDKDIGLYHHETSKKRHEGTCRWIFETDEYRSWKTTGSILWVNGGIGCGKSVLCSAAIENISQHCHTNTGNVLLYFYFSFRDQNKNNGHICLAALLKQLCVNQEVMAQVEGLYNQTKQGTIDAPPEHKEIKRCLSSAIAAMRGLKQVYIVLDALDELPNELDDLQQTQILDWISEVAARESHVHFLLTSRLGSHSAGIQAVMESSPSLLRITIDAASNREDMRLYIEGQFQRVIALKALSRKVNLQDMLLNKANGMFQWLQCQMADLAKFPHLRKSDIKRTLDSMPQTLGSTYSRILENVPKGLAVEVAKGLQWLAISLRPLTLEEVNEACIINTTNRPIVDEEDRLAGDDFVSLLPGLLSHTTGNSNTVSLSHLSVKEFLTSTTVQSSPWASYGFQHRKAHSSVAESCIAYIDYWLTSSPKVKTYIKQELDLYPLLMYACRYWSDHFKLADAQEQMHLVPAVIRLLNSTDYCTHILPIYNPLWEHYSFTRLPHSPNTHHRAFHSTLGWAAALRLTSVAKMVLSESTDTLDIQQDMYLSLPTKNCREWEEDPRLLHTLSGSMPGTALMKAAEFNHPEVALVLIENGANIHMKGPEGDTALSIACSKGREKVVKVLLENGADLNETGHSTPFALAVDSGSAVLCEMLLDAGASVQGQGTDAYTPLMIATSAGDYGLINLLLDRGADVNEQIDRSETAYSDPLYNYPDALTLATMLENLDMVKFLLTKGARISSSALRQSLIGQDGDPSESHRQVCELFIDYGADVNPDMPEYDPPLAMALYNGWYDVAQLMLDKGALVQPNDPTCRTAGNILVAAIQSVEFATRILDLGIDANAPVAFLESWEWEFECTCDPRCFATALQTAAYHLEIETVRLLLDRGAEATVEGLPFGNSLFAAFAGTLRGFQCAGNRRSEETYEAFCARTRKTAKEICAMLWRSRPGLWAPQMSIHKGYYSMAMKGSRELFEKAFPFASP